MLLCMVIGAVLVLVAEWYLFQRFLLSQPEVELPKQPFGVSVPFCLPKVSQKYHVIIDDGVNSQSHHFECLVLTSAILHFSTF